MGGLDLLPPAKAAARRTRALPVRAALVVVAVLGVLGVVYYAGVRERQPPLTASRVESLSPPPPPPLPSPSLAPVVAVAASPPPPQREVVTLNLALRPSGKHLTLRLRLLPEHSESSVAFMRHAARSGCGGELYRSEKDFLVQGRINCAAGAAVPTVVKGSCPAGVELPKSRACPSHDPNCGCHGPIMGKGMVGWAGGSAGPDLFIYTAHMDPSRCPVGGCEARHWSHDHTVFAEVADGATWGAINELYALPVKQQGMTFFADKIGLTVGQ